MLGLFGAAKVLAIGIFDSSEFTYTLKNVAKNGNT